MTKTVAVLTDATSAGYLFPHWVRYYAGEFGVAKLHAMTYRGLGSAFADLGLGSVVEFDRFYDDEFRATAISEKVSALLQTNDVVIRCDVDEFLVPDRRKHGSLAAYVENLEHPYVTAIGLDVVETADDAQLDLRASSLLDQRQWCIRTAALNKTAVVAQPLVWAAGFHAANMRPYFDDLYLLHLKFADIQGRIAWFTDMLDKVRPGSNEYVYYADGRAKLESYAKWLNSRPRDNDPLALYDRGFLDHFMQSVSCNPENGIWQGDFCVDGKLIDYSGNLSIGKE